DDRDRAVGGHVLHPLSDDLRIGDVRSEEEEILLGQRSRERNDAVRVGGRHLAQADRRVVVEGYAPGIIPLAFRGWHLSLLSWLRNVEYDVTAAAPGRAPPGTHTTRPCENLRVIDDKRHAWHLTF